MSALVRHAARRASGSSKEDHTDEQKAGKGSKKRKKMDRDASGSGTGGGGEGEDVRAEVSRSGVLASLRAMVEGGLVVSVEEEREQALTDPAVRQRR